MFGRSKGNQQRVDADRVDTPRPPAPLPIPDWLTDVMASASPVIREGLTEAWRIGFFAGLSDRGGRMVTENPFLRIQLNGDLRRSFWDESS